MRKLFVCGVAVLPFAASAASGVVVYNNMNPNNEFVTGISSIYFDDANLAMAGTVQINQFDLGYENLSASSSASNFDLLVQFYNTVNYGASLGTPVGTNPIGSLIDITGLSATGGNVGATGLVALSGSLPVATSGTVGYEFEFVTPGTTSFGESNIDSSIVPIFRSGSPSIGNSSGFFAYDYLGRSSIVGDARSGDVFSFANAANVFAQIGAVAAAAVTVLPNQTYAVSPGSALGLSQTIIAGITVSAAGTAIVPPAINQSSRQLLTVTSPGLAIAGSIGNWTGLLDLSNNDLDLAGASLGTVTDQIRQGYANGNWNSSGGILSSSAASNTSHLTALGVIQNNQGGSPMFTKFDGYVVGASDVLVKYTYYGDTNLDGKVDGSDYSRIDNADLANGVLTGWYNGDFNYDGVINGSDYTLIDNAYNTQGASFAAAVDASASVTAQIAPAPVPEPAALSILALAGAGTLGRCRRPSRYRLKQNEEIK